MCSFSCTALWPTACSHVVSFEWWLQSHRKKGVWCCWPMTRSGLLGMNEAPPSLQVEQDSEAGHGDRDAWQELALKPPLLTKTCSRDLGRREDAAERGVVGRAEGG